MTTNKDLHEKLLNEFYKQYELLEDKNEFTWDGPSDWDAWENEKPKILFLLKEARQGWHPRTPKQKIENKLGKNIARWKSAIKKLYLDKSASFSFPNDNDLSEYNDDIAFVEVKKINEEKVTSNNKEILYYATKDKSLLQQQIDLINPHIVVCCYTFDCYDTIYDFSYKIEEELSHIEKCKCWKLNERLVFDFFHPSTWPSHIDPNDNDLHYFEILCKMLKDENVQNYFL